MTNSKQLYNASLLLNSRGITLMELDCNSEAIDAFSAAFRLMKESFALFGSVTKNKGTEKLLSTLHTTSTKITEVKSQIAATVRTNQIKTIQNSEILVVPFCQNVTRDLYDAALSSPSCSKMVLLSMDDQGGECENDDADLQMDSSIILQNLGSAYFVQGKMYAENNMPSKAKRSFTKAHSAYKLAYTVLSDGQEYDMVGRTWFVLTSMITLQYLTQLSFVLGFSQEGSELYSTLGDFRCIMDNLRDLFTFEDSALEVTVAAAA